MRLIVGALCSALALTAATAQAHAQSDYPNKPVRVLVPFAPGGFVDVAARIVGQKLSEKWKQQVIVENRPGGNGFIAVTAAAKSPADGYTLLMAHSGEFVVNPAVFAATIPYNMDRDFHADHAGEPGADGARRQVGRPVQDAGRTRRRGEGQARHRRHEHARHRQHQSSGRRVDCALARRQVPARALQGRRAGRGRDLDRRGAVRHGRGLVGDAADQGRPREGAGDHHGEAHRRRQVVADRAGGRRQGRGPVDLVRPVRAQGHAAADRRQDLRRRRRNPADGRREGEVRGGRRRRRRHEARRVHRADQARGREAR